MPYDEKGNWYEDHDGSINSLGPRWRMLAAVSAMVIGVALIVVLLFWIASGRGI